MKETTSKTKWTRRGAIAAMLYGAAEAYMETRAFNWKRMHERTYGTLENPVYSIENNFLPARSVLAELKRHELMSDITEPHSMARSRELKSIRKLAQDWSDKVDRLETVAKTHGRAAVRGEAIALQGIILDYAITGVLGGGSLSVEYDPVGYAREIFQRLTGKSLPPSLRIEKSTSYFGDSHLGGRHISFEDRVIYKANETDKSRELSGLLHEFGHVAAQHEEQAKGGILRRFLNRFVKNVVPLEEACAFSFLDASIYAIAQDHAAVALRVKAAFEAEMEDWANYFFSGNNDKPSPHFEGAVIFLAARAAYRDPKKVFNALARVPGHDTDNLPPAIQKKLAEARKNYHHSVRYKQEWRVLMEKINEASRRLVPFYKSIRTRN